MGGGQSSQGGNGSMLWNAPVDTSGQLAGAPWEPLDPDDPFNYKFSEQKYLGPGNERANSMGFQMLMDDLARKYAARVEAENANKQWIDLGLGPNM